MRGQGGQAVGVERRSMEQEIRELEKEVKHYRRIVIFLVAFDVSFLVSFAIAIVARFLLC